MDIVFRMKPRDREYITSHIFKIGHKLGNHSLYCEIRHFASPVVTWEKRKLLRKKLVQSLKKITMLKNYSANSWAKIHQIEKEWDKLLKPGSRPVHCLSPISIAHCPIMGGFIFSFNKDLLIGFDIEIAERIHDKLIRRVANTEEIKQAPDKALLWTAKEASFKCLNLKTGSFAFRHCQIFDWIKFDSAYLFSWAYKNQKGQGGAFRVAELAFAYAHRRAWGRLCLGGDKGCG